MSIDADLVDAAPDTPVVTTDPFAPANPSADSLKGDVIGGMTTMTICHICGDRALQYLDACNSGIAFLTDSWPNSRRALHYYSQGNTAGFETAIKAGATAGLLPPDVGFATAHERASHAYTVLAQASLAILPKRIEGERYLGRLERKHTAALRNTKYVNFLRAAESRAVLDSWESRLFTEMCRFIDNAEVWRIGLMPRFARSDYDLADGRWMIMRNEFPILRDLYIQGYEIICHLLEPIIAAQNSIKRGDPHDFGAENPPGRPNQRLPPPASMKRFRNLGAADKLCFVGSIPGVDYLATLLDGQLRNTIGHASAHHDLASGRMISDKDPAGVPYLLICERVADLFEALFLTSCATRCHRVAASPDFHLD